MRNLEYRVSLEFTEGSLDFQGQIELVADDLPERFDLDSEDLTVQSVSVEGHSVPYLVEPREARLRVGPVPPGARSVKIQYSGRVDDKRLAGLYLSPLGPGRVFTTDLEPAAARRVFPCFDTPDRKAVFSTALTYPADLVAISNSPVAETSVLADGRRRTRFSPTPPMSPYLFYAGVGPFEERAGSSKTPAVVVATAPGRSSEGEFALGLSQRMLDGFARYYGIDFPMPKLHLVAVPRYGSGAMENWGAITFQEYYLLLGPRSPASARQLIAKVLAHELAHQWFGNLVTMRAWSDLWLNESFATFVGFRAVAAEFPDWRSWEVFLLDETAGAMGWDSLPHTHPIQRTTADLDEIQESFDEISYGKGASVLRMVEAYLGEERFRAGVSEYLQRYKWGNAEAADLWRALSDRAQEPVDRVLSSWVGREGFPMVIVSRVPEGLRFDQRRFELLPTRGGDPWPIPLTYLRAGSMERHLFDSSHLVVPGATDEPILVNPGRTGFYRVRYDGRLRAEIWNRYSELPAIDRWGLLDDALAFLLAGDLSLDDYLSALRSTEPESDPFVLDELFASMAAHYPLISRIPRWKSELARLISVQTDRLGLHALPTDSERVKGTRESLLEARTILDPAFATQLAQRYAEVDTLEPELVAPVLFARAITAGPVEAQSLRERLRAAEGVEASRRVAAAIGLLRDPAALSGALDLMFTEGLPLGAWGPLFGSAVTYNTTQAAPVAEFLDRRMPEIAHMMTGTGGAGRLLRHTVPFLGLARPAETRAWLAHHRFPESAGGVQSGLDLLSVYERLLARDSGHPE